MILTSDNSSMKTDYFDCPLGVKQGDILSPTLFSIFVNSLTVDLGSSELGVNLDLPPSQDSSDNNIIVNHLIKVFLSVSLKCCITVVSPPSQIMDTM